MKYNLTTIRSEVLKRGFKFFEDSKNKGYDVNIIGIRNNSTNDKVTNVFDDLITISYKDEKGVWQYFEWAATTDPGTKGAREFHNKKGVARLIPGQYRGVWSIDLHQGKYEALCQRNGTVKVWRDGNKDMVFDEVTVDEGVFGINIHKAGLDSTWVENWSEGCTVFKRVKDFNQFMAIVKRAAKIHGNKFTYTLLEL